MLVSKNNYKTLFYVVLGVILVYLMIYIFTPKQQMPDEYKNALDSLNRVNAELIKKQKQSDSLISVYQNKIDSINYKINNNKEKVTIIREYYHEIQKEINTYNSSQIESFLKNRYNY